MLPGPEGGRDQLRGTDLGTGHAALHDAAATRCRRLANSPEIRVRIFRPATFNKCAAKSRGTVFERRAGIDLRPLRPRFRRTFSGTLSAAGEDLAAAGGKS